MHNVRNTSFLGSVSYRTILSNGSFSEKESTTMWEALKQLLKHILLSGNIAQLSDEFQVFSFNQKVILAPTAAFLFACDLTYNVSFQFI